MSDAEDDDMMARLRRIAAEVDAPPELVTESARAAFTTRRLDEELAELLHDSAVSGSSVRGAVDIPRLLSFEAGEVALELQVARAGDRLTLRGLAVNTSGAVEIESRSSGRRSVDIDAGHGFAADGLPAEPLRVRVRAADGTTVVTGWIAP